MRIMGVDFGQKKVGLAVATGKVALPLEMVANNKRLFSELRKISQEEEIKEVVVGLPLNLDGTEGEMARRVKTFGQSLEKELGIGVAFWDERLTTREARQKFRNQKVEDSGAAALTLQSYLDSQN